jgi:hypothetical protein
VRAQEAPLADRVEGALLADSVEGARPVGDALRALAGMAEVAGMIAPADRTLQVELVPPVAPIDWAVPAEQAEVLSPILLCEVLVQKDHLERRKYDICVPCRKRPSFCLLSLSSVLCRVGG